MDECDAIRQRSLVTVPNERTQAVLHTRAFLELFVAGCLSDYDNEDLKAHVQGLLRHFPNSSDMHMVAIALPKAWGPQWAGPFDAH
ncbi:BPSL0761 family protein [Variovorax gracilis]|uniref:BPSL0761 family protein n=1 Tax=Variovorax gracilis TaxID=3053502 RepID=UPI00336C2A48